MNEPQGRNERTPWSAILTAAALCSGLLVGCATTSGSGAVGSTETLDSGEQKAMTAIGAKVKGRIVWSSSRVGNHDLFVMDTDGSNIRQITKGDAVDWFPRFSPDGKKILFTRSKKGWVFERDANTDGKWDLFTVNPEGGEETKVVDNASWGNWVSNDELIYARSTRIYRRALSGGDETLMVDSNTVPALDSALVQQPELSHDGKYIAITLRGSKRETGIWDVEKKVWRRTGEGCQINWEPDGSQIYWVHPTGNGGSRVLHMPIDSGKPTKTDADADSLTLIDIPGRRSHEYFPQLSRDGKWLVWAATQRGHDHDIADYEIYLWQVGSDPEAATRLTHHSGNDRWPDIFLGDSVAASDSDAAGAHATKPSVEAAEREKEEAAAAEAAATAAATSKTVADNEESAAAASGKGKKGHKKLHGKKTKRHKKKD